jgi:hypothetical protein
MLETPEVVIILIGINVIDQIVQIENIIIKKTLKIEANISIRTFYILTFSKTSSQLTDM